MAFLLNCPGILTFVARESTRGDVPRNFMLTNDGRHIIVANQNSKKLVVFEVDGKGGMKFVSEAYMDDPPTFVCNL